MSDRQSNRLALLSSSRFTFRPLTWHPARASRAIRAIIGIAIIGTLASCATHQQVSAPQEAAQYAARARRDYTPPGPPSDPWGPYIVEAAAKYDMPERWIREVIRAESGGRLYEKGTLITSDAGAMGLMQVMPATFDELRARYSLGDDPYDPHDNIMAGSAYLRELYDVYGSPGFLAAYNAGPGKLDDYLNHNKSLPLETRNYVAKIGPNIQDTFPQRPSAAGELAMNQIPIYIPAGPRYPHVGRYGALAAYADNRVTRGAYRGQVQTAAVEPQRGTNGHLRQQVQMASIPEPPRYVSPTRETQRVVFTPGTQAGRNGFHLIPAAMAETVPLRRGGPVSGNWSVQVGAFGNEGMARAAADAARGQSRELASAHAAVGTVRQARATLYRARLTGLSRESAVQACEHLSRGRNNCIVVSPDSRS